MIGGGWSGGRSGRRGGGQSGGWASGRCLSGRLLSGRCLSGGLRPYILISELHIVVIPAHKNFNSSCFSECSTSR